MLIRRLVTSEDLSPVREPEKAPNRRENRQKGLTLFVSRNMVAAIATAIHKNVVKTLGKPGASRNLIRASNILDFNAGYEATLMLENARRDAIADAVTDAKEAVSAADKAIADARAINNDKLNVVNTSLAQAIGEADLALAKIRLEEAQKVAKAEAAVIKADDRVAEAVEASEAAAGRAADAANKAANEIKKAKDTRDNAVARATNLHDQNSQAVEAAANINCAKAA